MNRRTALKQVFIVTAGAAILPGCVQNDTPTIALKKIKLTGSQQKTLWALSAAIIPSSKEFYGAAELKADEFTAMMVDDCEAPDAQKAFENGVKALEKKLKEDYNDSFDKLTIDKRLEVLNKLEAKSFGDDSIDTFYNLTKNYTVLAFTTSQTYLTDIRKYKMVPGSNFKGCVLVS
jgi:hypothetical protein